MNNPIIALLGNPNVGKTSLFNRITKLNQKVGNYPGITVEKREGSLTANNKTYKIIDLPGTYTLFPNSLDEEVVFNILVDQQHKLKPNLIVVVGEPSNLKRSIILYQQARELGLPAIFVINMIDEATTKGIQIDIPKLESLLKTKVFLTNARNGEGIDKLIKAFDSIPPLYIGNFSIPAQYVTPVEEAKKLFPLEHEYNTWQYLAKGNVEFLPEEKNNALESIRKQHNLTPQVLQKEESIQRNKNLEHALSTIVSKDIDSKSVTNGIDKILLHPILGYLIFFGVLFLIFQGIYNWSGPAMDFIDTQFADLAAYVQSVLPAGPLPDLLSNGIIKGIGGIVIFVPQIVILYIFISLMEETGYMSRVVFLMDRWLRPFGLNGKSVIPLISGVACAVPAVMSARNIENSKERLVTMLVTPFMTCSARLPIYIVIIGLVIPDTKFLGFNIQGIILFALYILGILAALGSAWLLNKIIKTKHKSFLIFELPTYKFPDWKNLVLNVWDKSSSFVFGAGKIILAISVILWALGSFGPGDKFRNAEEIVTQNNPSLSQEDLDHEISSYKVEHSYLGYLGMVIEPIVEPLGYDWKMGIGLISSFAAREVFVGTMATVYSIGDDADIEDDASKRTILSKMRAEVNRNTGLPAYNLASGVSLLLFYAFAMQCMSTIAIVKKETASWKWTLIQVGFMTGLAYIAALIAYQALK
ncbi:MULTISPECIES: ferrous iron transport protein B [unclassified Sphingobacterium]|uniref:ferrous iron transport protein B n=1 Tax=unclassified Sphingobacterium TaxID=2609468 RepID=UPI001048774A|nr:MULTISPECIES: ferrous iron transport protein B [unclassified Sphingobacterium]MCS3556113.1 ferrous iron transport protein B [Sphingobacterium sp. JUb21]TCR08489.1 ferrous iron transport protein B [Sphingobacterium sp. JUb20]